jgi:hypothetical protein
MKIVFLHEMVDGGLNGYRANDYCHPLILHSFKCGGVTWMVRIFWTLVVEVVHQSRDGCHSLSIIS